MGYLIIYNLIFRHQKSYMQNQKRLGKYQILRTLGSGGSCKVKLGFNPETGEKVAIKIMSTELDAKT
jgi:serine/threonine protein kinase